MPSEKDDEEEQELEDAEFAQAGLTEADWTVHPILGRIPNESGTAKLIEAGLRSPPDNRTLAERIAAAPSPKEFRQLHGIPEPRDFSQRKRMPRKPKP